MNYNNAAPKPVLRAQLRKSPLNHFFKVHEVDDSVQLAHHPTKKKNNSASPTGVAQTVKRKPCVHPPSERPQQWSTESEGSPRNSILPNGSNHLVRGWLGCTITSSAMYFGSITILRRGDWIPRAYQLINIGSLIVSASGTGSLVGIVGR